MKQLVKEESLVVIQKDDVFTKFFGGKHKEKDG